MLILKRQVGESIIIGNGDSRITVTLSSVSPQSARIGIDAPKTVPVYRSELYHEGIDSNAKEPT